MHKPGRPTTNARGWASVGVLLGTSTLAGLAIFGPWPRHRQALPLQQTDDSPNGNAEAQSSIYDSLLVNEPDARSIEEANAMPVEWAVPLAKSIVESRPHAHRG